ncbi:putative choline transporter Hnm1 [Aspergillus thermomutatus]|uniref:Uncharacterized protein n=1 Tax=Aspergillus thermomutatus TaxID=41047 RepID=A0A397HIS8_ASPTH|nr:uncharacterized protein CDV56_105171 [Aspergillus thermomutatus]RHZ61133.1 hypothetical protein CDV56_105171 [Aspergillus thermomutatus]
MRSSSVHYHIQKSYVRPAPTLPIGEFTLIVVAPPIQPVDITASDEYLNVLVGRRTLHRGPFFPSHMPGMAVNIITVASSVFAIVIFSFPYYMPVTGEFDLVEKKMDGRWRWTGLTASNMNYARVCVGEFLLIELLWWVVAGKKYSKSLQNAREEEQNAARAMMVTHEGKEEDVGSCLRQILTM